MESENFLMGEEAGKLAHGQAKWGWSSNLLSGSAKGQEGTLAIVGLFRRGQGVQALRYSGAGWAGMALEALCYG